LFLIKPEKNSAIGNYCRVRTEKVSLQGVEKYSFHLRHLLALKHRGQTTGIKRPRKNESFHNICQFSEVSKNNQIQGLTFAATRVIDRMFLEIKRKGIMIE